MNDAATKQVGREYMAHDRGNVADLDWLGRGDLNGVRERVRMRDVEPKCERCGMPRQSGKRGPSSRFCSHDCRWKAWYERKGLTPIAGKCVRCGRKAPTFVSSGKPKKYCDYCRLPVREMIVCTECGKEELRLPGTKTCSSECSRKRKRRRSLERGHPEMQCKYCGKRFRPKGTRLGYCSLYCGHSARKERNGNAWEHAISKGYLVWATSWNPCVWCGEVMVYGRKCCSDVCRSRWSNRRILKYINGVKPQCKDCGRELEYSSNCPPKRCAECQKIFKQQWKRRQKKLFGNHRKRAKTYGVPYEPIKATDIYKRDEYRCQICGKKVDSTQLPPHPRTPTIDHIVPMSKGGGHVWGNVQCACFECNCCHKRDIIAEETQMVLC